MSNQIKKYSTKQCNLKQQESLDLALNIISQKESVAMLEMRLKIVDTLHLPAIRGVFKGDHGQIGFSVVKVLVKRFMDSFGFSNKPTDSMIETITVDTLDKFTYETLSDIVIFFKMARSGSFGNTDRGVDSNLIFGKWYPMYLEQKSEIRENEYIERKNKINENLVSIEAVKKQYHENQEPRRRKLYKQKVTKRINEITKEFDRQMLEDLISTWEKDESKKPYLNSLKLKRKSIR